MRSRPGFELLSRNVESPFASSVLSLYLSCTSKALCVCVQSVYLVCAPARRLMLFTRMVRRFTEYTGHPNDVSQQHILWCFQTLSSAAPDESLHLTGTVVIKGTSMLVFGSFNFVLVIAKHISLCFVQYRQLVLLA